MWDFTHSKLNPGADMGPAALQSNSSSEDKMTRTPESWCIQLSAWRCQQQLMNFLPTVSTVQYNTVQYSTVQYSTSSTSRPTTSSPASWSSWQSPPSAQSPCCWPSSPSPQVSVTAELFMHVRQAWSGNCTDLFSFFFRNSNSNHSYSAHVPLLLIV